MPVIHAHTSACSLKRLGQETSLSTLINGDNLTYFLYSVNKHFRTQTNLSQIRMDLPQFLTDTQQIIKGLRSFRHITQKR